MYDVPNNIHFTVPNVPQMFFLGLKIKKQFYQNIMLEIENLHSSNWEIFIDKFSSILKT